MRNNGSVTILRWGLAFVFFYAAIASVTRPEHWASYVPAFIGAVMPPQSFLVIFSLYELILAGLLFAGMRQRIMSLLALITFLVIVVADFRDMSVVFTDVGLAFASLALFENARRRRGIQSD